MKIKMLNELPRFSRTPKFSIIHMDKAECHLRARQILISFSPLRKFYHLSVI